MGDGCMRCALLRTPGCNNNACVVESALYVESTNGLSVGLSYPSPDPFPFTCAVPDLLRGLSNETKGMIGLANLTTSSSAQISTQLKLPYRFALCMPSTSVHALGHMPYFFIPYYKDIAEELITTDDPSDEYFIDFNH
ncbi:hypothetical protein POM88_038028 [Heracleum sosnowskyi]|uniref:Xylanase inhibitor N-terminal domain-containing protein n=1 Tax=Heracleum sosnowskyi TaxID=360622 RepID=A0AAD8HS94_9APIA|nr:hypothetical protein POM88_038028 [Heracleum sosnowskyi]